MLNEEELSPIALSAKKVRTKLVALSAVGDRDPWWAVRFWQWCSQLQAGGEMPPEVLSMLRAHGYLGANTRTAPGATELAAGLIGLESVVIAVPPG